jgi:hypothetical protein
MSFKEWSSQQSTPKNKLAENPKVVPASAQPAPEPDQKPAGFGPANKP